MSRASSLAAHTTLRASMNQKIFNKVRRLSYMYLSINGIPSSSSCVPYSLTAATPTGSFPNVQFVLQNAPCYDRYKDKMHSDKSSFERIDGMIR